MRVFDLTLPEPEPIIDSFVQIYEMDNTVFIEIRKGN